MKLPSNHEIGQEAIFKPLIDDPQTMGVPCRIVSVKFLEDKVLYDIELKVNGTYHSARPLKEVDSIFVF